ncbi:hypothetical protein [Paraglaciecola sp.]|uniref:hypothetical protein n=1 Tax=Paraglaciecola sp. TaxID=1920173 RepID=UPI003263F659
MLKVRVKISQPNSGEELHLVSTERLLAVIDSKDLACRSSKEIKDAFHIYWFTENDEYEKEFIAPSLYISKGIAYFMNGRHRTVLLSKYLKEIPLRLAGLEGSAFSTKEDLKLSTRVLKEISIRKIEPQDEFEFPDLRIEYLGYDVNLGK